MTLPALANESKTECDPFLNLRFLAIAHCAWRLCQRFLTKYATDNIYHELRCDL